MSSTINILEPNESVVLVRYIYNDQDGYDEDRYTNVSDAIRDSKQQAVELFNDIETFRDPNNDTDKMRKNVWIRYLGNTDGYDERRLKEQLDNVLSRVVIISNNTRNDEATQEVSEFTDGYMRRIYNLLGIDSGPETDYDKIEEMK